jgi:sulfatase maturation enzyme AslB (radical SAM superfamily)
VATGFSFWLGNMTKIEVPKTYQYIGIFLTLSCNLKCSYCINHTVGLKQGRKILKADDWAKAFARIHLSHDIPLTFQGGEPSIHRDFFSILKSVPSGFSIDLLTNLQFSPDEFFKNVPPSRISRSAPYAPIRVSYHPETMDLDSTLIKIKRMMDLGYRIGLYSVTHPSQMKAIETAREACLKAGIDFRTKEFLGQFEGKIYGHYAYPGSVFSDNLKSCLCRTSELLVDPFGDVFRCHHDLYNKVNSTGNILDPDFHIDDIYRPCSVFGKCNPCDVKVKNNYKQEFGHTSVSIQLT